ncbi:hypothetical protein Plhal703r1_c04g0021471 [Plasmopara halstedii]
MNTYIITFSCRVTSFAIYVGRRKLLLTHLYFCVIFFGNIDLANLVSSNIPSCVHQLPMYRKRKLSK